MKTPRTAVIITLAAIAIAILLGISIIDNEQLNTVTKNFLEYFNLAVTPICLILGIIIGYPLIKRKLAEIIPFYDYSLQNEYNMSPLDENNMNFIDNIHPSNTYNNLIVFDLLSDNKKIGTYITKDNIENYLKKDTENLKTYIEKNPQISEKIKNVRKEDADISVRRKNAF